MLVLMCLVGENGVEWNIRSEIKENNRGRREDLENNERAQCFYDGI